MKLNDILKEANKGKVNERVAKGLKPLLTLGSKVTWKTMSEDALLDLSEKFDNIDDEVAEDVASYLNMAIENKQDGKKGLASKALKAFNKACKDALTGKPVKSVFEGKINEKKSSPYGEIMQKLDKGLKKAIKSGGVPTRYAKDYVKDLEKFAKKNAKNFFKDYGKFSADDFEEDVIYNMQNEEYSVKTEDHDCFAEWLVEKQSQITEAEYQGRTVKLNKPMQGDASKFKVYVNGPKGKVVKVNFGAKGSENRIKKSDPARRKSFRARHNCDNPGPKHKARYWSCRKW